MKSQFVEEKIRSEGNNSKEKDSEEIQSEGNDSKEKDSEKINSEKTGHILKNQKGKVLRSLARLIVKTVLLSVLSVLIFTCVLKVRRAAGNAMSPFVRDGDLCVFYTLEKVQLNDVVLYRTEDGDEKIGRITAVGGQTVDFPEDGGYTVDGYQPSEEIPYETYKADTEISGSDTEDRESAETEDDEYPLTLDEETYFIMNDFRSLTNDSRESGAVSEEQIEGKLLFMLRRRNF